MKTVLNRLYVYVPLALVAVFQNLIHESLHYMTARLLGENILEFHLLTNGWLTSQVIYATPMEQRTDAYWLLIAWLPAVTTTLIGFLVYANRERWITRWPPINLVIWYVGELFMMIDPLYFGVLSWFMQRSDVSASEILGWSPVPFQLAALLVSVIAAKLVLDWRREARTDLHRYRISSMETYPNK